MNKLIIMTEKESERIGVLERYIHREISGKEASLMLGVCDRQIRNLAKKYKDYGAKSLIHGNRGKVSNRRFSKEFILQVETIIQDKQYKGFGPQLMKEKLEEVHNIKVSKERLRKIMIKLKLYDYKERKISESHRENRPSKDCEGEMIQFDGSYHKWLEERDGGNDYCLLLAVDDATGKIMHAKLGKNEGLKEVSQFWKDYCIINGKPKSIYLDKFSTYKSNKYKNATYEPETPTQFRMMCNYLDIHCISAHSPQAKGKVERMNKTLQDRLIKELRLAGITNLKDANKFILETFIPKFNKKFGIKAKSEVNIHSKLNNLELENLDRIFARKEKRVIANDYTISYQGQLYQLYKTTFNFYPKLKVVVEEHINGKITISFRSFLVKHKKIKEKPPKYTDEELLKMKKEKEIKAKERAEARFLISKKKQYFRKASDLKLKIKSLKGMY